MTIKEIIEEAGYEMPSLEPEDEEETAAREVVALGFMIQTMRVKGEYTRRTKK